MTCGDTTGQWVDPLLGSTWSGTVGSDGLLAAFTVAQNVAATTVGVIPGVGVWTYDYDFRWSAALEGIEWHFEVRADTCSDGKVTAASGGATDANGTVHSVSMTRIT